MNLGKVESIETEELPPGCGLLAVMDHTGDTRIIWNRDNADEVANARRTFDDLRAKGFDVFSVRGKEGEKAELMATFNPDAERLIASPRMQGG
jgi:hypothetical protein